jgi:hypothetical protein
VHHRDLIRDGTQEGASSEAAVSSSSSSDADSDYEPVSAVRCLEGVIVAGVLIVL